MAGQICLKCSLEIGKWGSRAKISTSWLAEKHTWLEQKEKANLEVSRRYFKSSVTVPEWSFSFSVLWFSVLFVCHNPIKYLSHHTCAQSLFIPSIPGLQLSCKSLATFFEPTMMPRLFLLPECIPPSRPTLSWRSNSSRSKQINATQYIRGQCFKPAFLYSSLKKTNKKDGDKLFWNPVHQSFLGVTEPQINLHFLLSWNNFNNFHMCKYSFIVVPLMQYLSI